MPWMNLGMLLFGLPPMLIGREARVPGLSWLALGVLSAIGMVWGMSFGDYVAMKWLGPLTSERVLVSSFGMTVGMLGGMFLACEFGRALSLAFPRKKSPPSA